MPRDEGNGDGCDSEGVSAEPGWHEHVFGSFLGDKIDRERTAGRLAKAEQRYESLVGQLNRTTSDEQFEVLMGELDTAWQEIREVRRELGRWDDPYS